MSNTTTIECPNCGTEININEVLSSELEKSLTQKHAQELEENRRKYKEAMQTLKAKERTMAEAKEKFDEELKRATQSQLKLERVKVQDELKKQLVEEQSESFALLQKELDEKSKQVQELNKSKAQIEKLKRDMGEVESKVKAEAQVALSQQLNLEKEKLAKQSEEMKAQALKEIRDANELELKAKDEKIAQMAKSIEDAKRKSEQGSMQVQGEALETVIESWLASQFPFDTVEEVKKGAFGADCVQTIHTRELQNCGVICYESKNTKAWSDAWVHKTQTRYVKSQCRPWCTGYLCLSKRYG